MLLACGASLGSCARPPDSNAPSADREYLFAERGDGGFEASNRRHRVRVSVGAGGVALESREAEADSWRLALRLAGIGREEPLEPLAAATARASGDRAELVYTSPPLTEWYRNTPDGVEQGFTLGERPSGSAELPLLLALEVQGGSPRANPRGVELVAASRQRVLHYGELHAFDADGRPLDAEIRTKDGAIVLAVSDRGARYPLTIDPIITSPVLITFRGTQVNAELGHATSSAGDVNGDGFSDVLVAANRYDGSVVDGGFAAVFHGAETLAQNPSWSVLGTQEGEQLGSAVAGVGDVNGDGFDDVLVGASRRNGTFAGEGRVSLYLGSAAGLALSPVWQVFGGEVAAHLGDVLAYAGDLNGDGFADVALGVPDANAGGVDRGELRVYLGGASGPSLTPDWVARGDTDQGRLGSSLSAGDVDADGLSDLLSCTALAQPAAGGVAGLAWHGSASLASDLDGTPSNADWLLFGADALGTEVEAVGDVNGDGYADALATAPLFPGGRVSLYLGSATGLASATVLAIEGNPISPLFITGAASAGDVDGDGFADFAVRETSGYFVTVQYIRVYHGRATPQSATYQSVLNPAYVSDYGRRIAAAGDVDGDGFGDLLVADPVAGAIAGEGNVLLYRGTADFPTPTPVYWTFSATIDPFCLPPDCHIYYPLLSVSAGDVNGDGYSDYAIGSPAGSAFVYAGGPNGPGATPLFTFALWLYSSERGAVVALDGDLDGDGYSDLVVGESSYNLDSGAVFVFRGGPSFGGVGTPQTADWVASGNPNSSLGYALSSAGDIDGDGFSDLAACAPRFDNDAVDEGALFVWLGGADLASRPDGSVANASWRMEGNSAGDQGCLVVDTRGDVNGDGFSDVFVGSYLWTVPFVGYGAAGLWYGGASFASRPIGSAFQPDWGTVGIIPGGFASAISSAGDVDGDGFSDLLILESNSPVALRLWKGGPNEVGIVEHVSYDWAAISADGEVIIGGAPDATFVDAVDLDSDGRSEVIFGADARGPCIYAWPGTRNFTGAVSLSTAALALPCPEQAYAFAHITGRGFGDSNGDGFGEFLASDYLNFVGNVYTGNVGPGLPRVPRQLRPSGSAPLWPGARSPTAQVRLEALGRSPAGRSRVRAEWQVLPTASPFTGAAFQRGAWLDSGAPTAGGSVVPLSVLASGLAENTNHHWRLRVASPDPRFPHTVWLSHPHVARSGTAFRTGTGMDGDGDGVQDAVDNCDAEPNPSQTDGGQVGGPGSDGIGDACQCGDTDGDSSGDVDASDVGALRTHLSQSGGTLSPGGLARCSVIGGEADCDLRDATVLRRALASPPRGPAVAQVCAPAVP